MSSDKVEETGLGRQRSMFIDGQYMSSAQAKHICEKRGLCPKCGEVKTHVRKREGLQFRMKPLTTKDASGKFTVYKGYCISSLCYSLEQAKTLLGESVSRKHKKKYRSANPDRANASTNALSASGGSAVSTSPKYKAPPRMEPLLERESSSSGRRLSAPLRVSGSSAPRRSSDSGAYSSSERVDGGSFSSSGTGLSLSSGDIGQALDMPTGSSYDSFGSANYGSSNYGSSNGEIHFDSSRSSQLNESERSGSHRDMLRKKNGKKRDEDSVAIRELDRLMHEQRFSDFMDTIYSNSNLSYVVVHAFQLLRNNVENAHQTQGYIFSSPSWLKYFVDAMENNGKNQPVQVQGVLTLWTLCAVSPRYMRDIAKGIGVDAILSVMAGYKTDEEVLEMCCGALECLTSNRREGLSLAHRASRVAVTRLVDTLCREGETVRREGNFDVVLEGSSGNTKTWALRALYNLSVNDEESVLPDAVLNSVPILNIIERGEDEDRVEWAIRLLWKLLSTPPSTRSVSVAPFDIIDAVMVTLGKFDSPSFQEAACGLLSFSAVSSNHENVSVDQTQRIAESIVAAARSNPSAQCVQFMSVQLLCGLCSIPSNLDIIADVGAVGMVVEAMNSNQDHVELLGVACMLLAYLCWNRHAKVAIASENGIAAIASAFRKHVMNAATPSEMIKQGASIALACISANPASARMLVDSRILSDLVSVLREGNAPEMPPILRTLAINAMATGSLAAGGQIDPGVASLTVETLAGTKTEEEAEAIMASIHSMTCTSPDVLNFILGAMNGGGMDVLLQTMQNFLGSEIVQENGCAILANVYIKFPYSGELNKKTQLALGSQIVEIETHTERETKALAAAMNKHKKSIKVQDYACTALCNFIAGPNLRASSSLEIETPDEVVAVYSGISKKVLDAFAIHQDTLQVQRSACRLYWVIAFLNDEMEMKLRGNHGAAKVCEAMANHPEDDELNLAACGVLLAMIEDDKLSEFIGSNDSIRAMIRCLRSQNEDLVSLASELLGTTIQTVFTASNEFMVIEGSLEAIVLCMNEHPHSACVQTNLCSLIASLVALQDSYIKGLIGNCGGISAIQQALSIHCHDEMVVQCGCRALSSIVGGCSQDLIRDKKNELGHVLMSSLTDHPQNEVVQEAVITALWGLCAREPTFNDYIRASNGLPSIIDSINQNIMVETLVASGCSLLWIMATYGDNKARIGKPGVRAIVTGMQAHITSSAVQKEALTGLKNLATLRDNKLAIADVGGVAAIVQSMWVHMDSSQIFCAACSALNNIAVDAATKRVSRVENGELEAICFGMRRHSTDEDVQKCACFLLKSYTFEPFNIPLMRDQPNLVGMIMNAMDLFPRECAARAQYVLSRI